RAERRPRSISRRSALRVRERGDDRSQGRPDGRAGLAQHRLAADLGALDGQANALERGGQTLAPYVLLLLEAALEAALETGDGAGQLRAQALDVVLGRRPREGGCRVGHRRPYGVDGVTVDGAPGGGRQESRPELLQLAAQLVGGRLLGRDGGLQRSSVGTRRVLARGRQLVDPVGELVAQLGPLCDQRVLLL